MIFPDISRYAYSVANPKGLFRTLGNFSAEKDNYGDVRIRAGNNSAIFKLFAPDGAIMLKCYIKSGLHREAIYDYMANNPSRFWQDVRLLRREMYVYDIIDNGDYYDVVAAPWIDGLPLEAEIKRAGRETGEDRFRELADKFDRMALEILRSPWAHGDIKPENIVVDINDELHLIDFDAMFVPGLEGQPAQEVGTFPYQHPARNENFFNRHIDDYSIALLSVSLHALGSDDSLYKRYNRPDNLILDPGEILAGTSECFSEITDLFIESGQHGLYRLAMSLQSPTPEISDLTEILETIVKRSSLTRTSIVCDVAVGYDSVPELFEKDGKWGYKLGGKEIIPAIFVSATEFREGLAVVVLNDHWQVIDTDGNMVFDCSRFQQIKPFSEGAAAVCADGKWGFIDRQGNVVIEPQYQMAGPMREGRAVVKKGGKYGYIDSFGEVVIDFIYDYAAGFRHGKAIVCLDGEITVIDYFDNNP